MPTHNVNLSPHHTKFLKDTLASGRYQNVSELVRAALRLLEQREAEDAAKLTRLRALAASAFDAIDQGEAKAMTPAQIDARFASLAKPSARGKSSARGKAAPAKPAKPANARNHAA